MSKRHYISDSLEHDYASVVTEPTCISNGYTTYTCQRCGDSYVDDYVDMLGHTYVIDSDKEATCTETGLTMGIHCQICDDVLVAQSVIPATDHNYELSVVDATCTGQGYSLWTCEYCGDSYSDGYVDALGHEYQDGACARCGEEDPDFVVGPKILSQPVDFEGVVGDMATFAVVAEGEGLTYQWYFSTDFGETWEKSYSPGYATNALAPILRAYRDGNMYKCLLTDIFGNTVESDPVSMEVESCEITILAEAQSIVNGIQGQLAQCCCENKTATLQTQAVVQNEGNLTRLAIQQQTQAILDKMCQQEIDSLKGQVVNLQNQLNMATLNASQTAQTAQIIAALTPAA